MTKYFSSSKCNLIDFYREYFAKELEFSRLKYQLNQSIIQLKIANFSTNEKDRGQL